MIRSGLVQIVKKHMTFFKYPSGTELYIDSNLSNDKSLVSSLCYEDNNYNLPYNKLMKRPQQTIL